MNLFVLKTKLLVRRHFCGHAHERSRMWIDHSEDLIRQNQEYLEDFNAALDQLLKRKAEFQAEHPAFGRYSFP